MEDSEIVVVCHCIIHNPMHRVREGVLAEKLGPEVHYVDENPECPNSNWERIPDNSKMVVWGQNCPVGLIFTNMIQPPNRELTQILEGSHRVLKKGGKVIFPGKMQKSDEDFLKAKLRRYAGWDFSIVENPNDLPIILGALGKNTGTYRGLPTSAVFTKIETGGKRRRTIKRRRRKTHSKRK